ncbi:hypothetical protein K6W16_10385 [Burkholderia dolosa]|uniref:Gp11 n=2 Tax=Burkholderiaceae TaxID=119060 RepID=A0A892IDI2_9BURK|nr:hypothetical protein AK34_727 [Burkholderia dolosa AU0158]AKE03039.1 hypothetical protein XM57_08850 [Burkholderia cepacia]AYZ97793.1 hypothetical protein EGY28_22805 [Burkholderia dolosa]ETP64862.1 hypothetical protein BDSB_05510 [Burkholderia dolosa PC543]PRE49229.1 hypothetical protein C6P87_14930 [Burkholderia sp. AU12872]PUA76352.1 hypothetical protein DB771_13225 [Burkholderia sp. AU29985]
MTSSVSICSSALLQLGDKPISSFDEPTDRALVCSNLYAEVRDAMLRAHPWNSCTKRVVLAPLAEAPPFDYPYQFQLPADWLRTIQVGSRKCPLDYAAEGNRILAFVNAMPFVYIFRNENEATWESTLVDVVTKAIKAAIAYPITQSAAMAQTAQTEFAAFLKQAKAINGQDDDTETIGDFPLLESRLSSYTTPPGRAPGR